MSSSVPKSKYCYNYTKKQHKEGTILLILWIILLVLLLGVVIYKIHDSVKINNLSLKNLYA